MMGEYLVLFSGLHCAHCPLVTNRPPKCWRRRDAVSGCDMTGELFELLVEITRCSHISSRQCCIAHYHIYVCDDTFRSVPLVSTFPPRACTSLSAPPPRLPKGPLMVSSTRRLFVNLVFSLHRDHTFGELTTCSSPESHIRLRKHQPCPCRFG